MVYCPLVCGESFGFSKEVLVSKVSLPWEAESTTLLFSNALSDSLPLVACRFYIVCCISMIICSFSPSFWFSCSICWLLPTSCSSMESILELSISTLCLSLLRVSLLSLIPCSPLLMYWLPCNLRLASSSSTTFLCDSDSISFTRNSANSVVRFLNWSCSSANAISVNSFSFWLATINSSASYNLERKNSILY